MIEAMACGTPVIAWPNGSVPEVIDDGVTGFIVGTINDAVRAVGRVGSLSRLACRNVFEVRFDARRMARDYLDVYRRLVRHKSETVRQSNRDTTRQCIPAMALARATKSPAVSGLRQLCPARSPIARFDA